MRALGIGVDFQAQIWQGGAHGSQAQVAAEEQQRAGEVDRASGSGSNVVV